MPGGREQPRNAARGGTAEAAGVPSTATATRRRRWPGFAAFVVGAVAVARVPFRIHGDAIEAMMRPPAEGAPLPDPEVRRRAGEALRVTRALLSRLARVPGSPWRNTCLYRSIAAHLVLARYGVPVRLRIGVRRATHGASPGIVAHAWLECEDPALAAEWWPGLTPLEPPAARDVVAGGGRFE